MNDAANKIEFGKFGPLLEEGASEITVNGVNVGWIERNLYSEHKSASSRAYVTRVADYTVVLTDSTEETDPTFKTLAEARKFVRKAFKGV